jgi:hypothetical protein
VIAKSAVVVELAINPINPPYCIILTSDISGSNVRDNRTELMPPITVPTMIALTGSGIFILIVLGLFPDSTKNYLIAKY